jgi:predicted O-methyltransferase YrrM
MESVFTHPRGMREEPMITSTRMTPPRALAAIQSDTTALNFTMASDLWTGSLLRTLAATRPGGAILELGTGTGLATAWLLDGMDRDATLLTVDNDDVLVSVARRHLGNDRRVTFTIADGHTYLGALCDEGRTFDLVFADAIPGKYANLDEALQLVRVGGLYVVDDMLPQPNWPPEHPAKVARFVDTLLARPDLRVTPLNWSTGIILATKVA